MADEPKVKLASDKGEALQWGKSLFFFQDGGKLTLKTKALLFVGAFVVVSASLFQSSGLESPVFLHKNSLIELPTALGSQKLLSVTEAPKDGVQGKNKKEGTQRKLSGPQLVARPRDLKLIPPGSMMKAVLVSGASNGLVKAKITEPLRVNGDTFIDEGSTLLGTGSSTEERLFVSFTQVIFKDGTFGQIQAQACDMSDQIVGLKGARVGSKAIQVAGSLGMGFLGGMSQGLQDTQGEFGAVVTKPSLKNALLNGTATSALQESQQMMSDLKNRQPILEVPVGTSICVLTGSNQ